MKKLLLVLALVLTPLVALGGTADDVLLTSSGRLFTIQSVAPEETVGSSSSLALRLVIQDGDDDTAIYVPASLDGGSHYDPSLAYDAATDTLFLFWVAQHHAMTSELLFCSYHDGEWSEISRVDADFSEIWRYRANLSMEVTRRARTIVTLEDGTTREKLTDALAVHAVWWQTFGGTQSARYAIFSIQQGEVASIQVLDLVDSVPSDPDAPLVILPEDYNREIFRHPSLSRHPAGDGVRVLFADSLTNRFHELDLVPLYEEGVLHIPIGVSDPDGEDADTIEVVRADGVLHIPIGVTPGRDIDPPLEFVAAASSLETISSAGGDLLLHFRDQDRIGYLHFRNGSWDDVKYLRLSERVSKDAAVDALRRLATTR